MDTVYLENENSYLGILTSTAVSREKINVKDLIDKS